MSENSSSAYFNLMYSCIDIQIDDSIAVSFMITKLLVVVPLSILIVCLGCRRWKQQRPLQAESHSDVFSYNAAALELVFGSAVVLYCCGYYTGGSGLLIAAICSLSVAFPGEIILHVLTCMEYYLAVVHPVVYLGLRQSRGVRIRNVIIGCVWLLCFGWVGLIHRFYPDIPFIAYFVLLSTSVVIISFCSLSVLRVLIRRGPGEVGGTKEQADKLKKKAFFTITTILGVLLVYLLAAIVALAVKNSNLLSVPEGCLFLASVQWFGFPFSLVLLLLFLQRSRELQRCCCRAKRTKV